jgi:hypothetical protein
MTAGEAPVPEAVVYVPAGAVVESILPVVAPILISSQLVPITQVFELKPANDMVPVTVFELSL